MNGNEPKAKQSYLAEAAAEISPLQSSVASEGGGGVVPGGGGAVIVAIPVVLETVTPAGRPL